MLFKPQSLSSDSDDMDDNESTTTTTTNKLSSKSSYQHRNRCPQSLISSESLPLSSFTTNLPHLSSSNDDDIDRISQSSAYQSSSSYRSAIDSNFSIKINNNNNVAHHDRTTITEHYSLSSIMLPYHYHYHHRHLLKNFYQRCLLILFLISILFDYSKFVHCDRNHHISALCLRERVHPLSKKIDGAVITSKAENNLDCTITFQTDTILQKFMLRFEKLALDCNDHLYIYDGAHTIGNHKADLSCRSTRTEVGTIYTQSNFLTLRYQTDAYSKADNGFRLIITAYKDSKNYCREHRCANQYCISRDLVCDGVNHCGDNSDEHYYVHCQGN
ncbi:hypothetical protein DERP_014057 [Dermatophagoides pteronyssinus]|uniref:CUB domain-containing protein n=1 Tax=Dermatophagoides pteronyssinus TaxID=6956 RepID=A0ABQ8JDB5_DERPT|nr:hypothetical protein DERP_014057 [Dermatophagoides pteronyssinus]